ncbi:MAG: hypothetical protein JWN08_1842, partial [Frankiales bacterium]|nr:hypothetical protein [Frankiales bacterium]
PQAAPAPVAGAVQIGAASRVLHGTDVERVVDALVRYTPAVGAVTPTNVWGAEAVVVNGTVTQLRDRQAGYAGPTAIPSNGIVLSGHGSSRSWLLAHARVGASVTLPGATTAPVTTAPTPAPAPVVASSPAPVPAPTTAPTPPPTTAPTAPVSGTTGVAPMAYPTKAVAAYIMMWNNANTPKLASIPSNVNVVNLAFGQGTVPTMPGWGSQSEASFVADARALRARGVRIVLSVGGAGGAMNIANRQAFLDGVMAINAKIPLDGLDWDIEGAAMGASDVVYLSTTLKSLRGSAFAITMAPNGSNIDQYRAIAVQLHAKGALDMIGQQFYDAVVSPGAARGRVDQLTAAGIPDTKIGVGMMVGDADVYWTVQECLDAVKYIKATHPNIRGGYLWEIGRAGTADWADRVGTLLKGE